MPNKRLFVALPLSPEIIRELSLIPLKSPVQGLRWIPAENLHITLLFLGDTSETDVPPIINNLLPLQKTSQFRLQGQAIKAISRRGSTAMVWATFAPDNAFNNLVHAISTALRQPRDYEPLPHITLARAKRDFRGRIDEAVFPTIDHLQLSVTGFELWESVLKPSGAEYRSLYRFTLESSAREAASSRNS